MAHIIIEGIQHYPLKEAATLTGYPADELESRFRDKLIPGVETPSGLYFSMEQIKVIQETRKAAFQKLGKLTPPVISLERAAEITGYKPATLKEYVKKGRIPGTMTGNQVHFSTAQVNEISAMKGKPAKKPPAAVKKEPETVVAVKVRPQQFPPDLQAEYQCAKRIAKAMNVPVSHLLLTAARPEIEAKKKILKELLK